MHNAKPRNLRRFGGNGAHSDRPGCAVAQRLRRPMWRGGWRAAA